MRSGLTVVFWLFLLLSPIGSVAESLYILALQYLPYVHEHRSRPDRLFSEELSAEYRKAQLPQGDLIRKRGPT